MRGNLPTLRTFKEIASSLSLLAMTALIAPTGLVSSQAENDLSFDGRFLYLTMFRKHRAQFVAYGLAQPRLCNAPGTSVLKS